MNQEGNVLIAGWFSFEHGHATAGDMLTLQLVRGWLSQAGYRCDVAFDPPFHGGVNWRIADPAHYVYVVFVCGPFEQSQYEADFLGRFNACRLVGLNLSLPASLPDWQPFDLLLERNSAVTVRADLVFLSRAPRVPVVGVCLVEPYPGALDGLANAAIERLIASQHVAVVAIDTRLDTNSTGLRSAAEVESLIARVDVLITTRLHGMVLALKQGVPVLAIDPEAAGNKIRRQAEAIGWPIVFTADALHDATLSNAFEHCLTQPARDQVLVCRTKAVTMADNVREELLAQLAAPAQLETNHDARLSRADVNDWMAAVASPNRDSLVVSWQQRIRQAVKKTAKTIARWTLPGPIYRLLQTGRTR